MGLEVRREGEHEFVGSNGRDAEVRMGRRGAPGSFSPAELLQIAVAGCAALTAHDLIIRRIGTDSTFGVDVSAERREGLLELDAVNVRFDVDLGGVDQTEREHLAVAVDRAIERLCTVSRTLKKGIPVQVEFPTG